MRMFHEFRHHFGWVGTFITEHDVRESIQSRREADDLEPLTDEELIKATKKVTDTKSYQDNVVSWMQEEGWEIIHSIIHDEVEYPETKEDN
jgi:hypothetical protein